MERMGRKFRELLDDESYVFTGGVYSPLDAQIAERVGMKAIYLSGYSMALANGWPIVVGETGWVEAGVLLSYGADGSANFRRAAYYVDRILKGAKPADLPIEQPTRFELAVNMKTARALSLVMPPEIMVRADRIIE